MPTVTQFFTSLRTDPETASLKIGAAGYCWGGKHTVLLTHGPTPLIDAGFTAHPSNLSVPRDIEGVQAPLFVSVGDADIALGLEKIRVVQGVLAKKRDDCEVVVLEGAKHGFAARADPREKRQVECQEIAERQALEFFGRWLGGGR